jgi:hypothetical protein
MMTIQSVRRFIGDCFGAIALVLDTLMNRSFFTSLLPLNKFSKETIK